MTFREAIGRDFTLAGSPSSDQGAALLKAIFNAAMPARNARQKVGGVWVLEEHKDLTLHLHAVAAFMSEAEAVAFLSRLDTAYHVLTMPWRSLRVIAAFGVYHQVLTGIAIKVQSITHDLAKVVNYTTKHVGLDAVVAGRKYCFFGALYGAAAQPASVAARQPAEVISIKLYQGVNWPDTAWPRVSSRLESASSTSRRRRFERPPAPAPPSHDVPETLRSLVGGRHRVSARPAFRLEMEEWPVVYGTGRAVLKLLPSGN